MIDPIDEELAISLPLSQMEYAQRQAETQLEYAQREEVEIPRMADRYIEVLELREEVKKLRKLVAKYSAIIKMLVEL